MKRIHPNHCSVPGQCTFQVLVRCSDRASVRGLAVDVGIMSPWQQESNSRRSCARGGRRRRARPTPSAVPIMHAPLLPCGPALRDKSFGFRHEISSMVQIGAADIELARSAIAAMLCRENDIWRNIPSQCITFQGQGTSDRHLTATKVNNLVGWIGIGVKGRRPFTTPAAAGTPKIFIEIINSF